MIIKNLYPLSTRSGQAVPLDVIRPTFLQAIDFTPSSIASAEIDPLDSTGIVILRASEDCVVGFGDAVAAIPVSGAPALIDCLLLGVGEVQIVAPPDSYFTVIGLSHSGTLYIQGVEAWRSLTLEMQQSRI